RPNVLCSVMFLLLGRTNDACLLAVQDALRRIGKEAEIASSPFKRPGRAAWSFPSPCDPRIWLGFDTNPTAVEAVFCRENSTAAAPLPDIADWSAEDLTYARAEADAALLGWLSGVQCRVVDRLPAWLWYNTRPAVLSWAGTLAENGLP